MTQSTVLIVDDEKNILLTLGQALTLEGYRTELAGNAQVALEVMAAKPVDAVLLDVMMPGVDGLALLGKLHALRPDLPVLMMSGHGSIDTAVQATRAGARDFLEKPVGRERLLLSLRNALEHRAVAEELEGLRAEAPAGDMLGSSAALLNVRSLIEKAAPTEGRVLITGENGTGKELIARALHDRSRRRTGPFIRLNCAAVPAELIESELFGHEKGAFTGAVVARRGRFEQAHQGTLFLDEVGDMPLSMQSKLLRVLQEGELERVGGNETLKVDVRVVAATNKNLEAEVRAGRFREDLYFRLNVVPIHSPALRDRRDDIAVLATAFLDGACKRNGRRPLRLMADALALLSAYDFPGNVRELRNLVERCAILCEGPVLTAASVAPHMPAHTARPEPLPSSATLAAPVAAMSPSSQRFREGTSFHTLVEEAEREIVLGALQHAQDNAAEAARVLGLERGHFYKKMKALGLKRVGGETLPSPSP